MSRTAFDRTPPRRPGCPHEAAEFARLDDAEGDLRRHLPRVKPGATRAFAARYVRVSPRAPHPRAHQVFGDWAAAEREAAGWEREFAAHPSVLAALGRKYDELGRHDDAERVLLAAVKLSPDSACYQRLMTIYGVVRKDEAKILAVTADRLRRLDYGTDRPRMRVRIAEVYAKRKDFRTALKYAEKAADDSGAAWAMRPTIYYAGQVGDKQKALMWERRYQERYGR